jgi:hypothetical protein
MYNQLLPFPNHPSSPCVDTKMIPPDRKPRKPPTENTEKAAEEDRQSTFEDAELKRIIEELLEP